MELLTLISDRGPIEPASLEPLTAPIVRGSLIRARATTVRIEDDGRRATILRYPEPHDGPTEVGDGWAAYDGLAVVPGGGTDVRSVLARALTERVDADTLARRIHRLRGVVAVCASLPSGDLVVVTDPLGAYPVFTGTAARMHAITTNPLLLEAALELLGSPVARTAAGLGTEAVFGSGALGSTGFEGVRMTPGGHGVIVPPGGRPRTWAVVPPAERYHSDEDLEVLLDRAADEIRENVRSVAAGDHRLRVSDLTGGVDSRLVFAALLDQGLDDRFGFFCAGRHPGPDYSTSAYLQDIYQVTEARGWLPVAQLRLEDEPVATMRHLLYRTMGCYAHNFLTGVGSPREPDLLRLHGGFGEPLRTFYSTDFDGTHATDAADHLLRERRWDWRRRLLTSGFAEQLETAVRGSIDERCAAGVDPARALEHWYLEHRNRYHIGLIWRLRLLQHASFHPLYSPTAVAAASQLPLGERRVNRIGFELMHRLHAPLATLPFAEYRWASRLTDPTPDAELYRGVRPFTPRSPVVELQPGRRRRRIERRSDTGSGAGAGTGRRERSAWAQRQLAQGRAHWLVPFDEVLPATRTYLHDLGSSSPMWDVFDRDTSLALVDRPLDDDWDLARIQVTYKLLAAGIWISGDEAPNAAGDPLAAGRP